MDGVQRRSASFGEDPELELEVCELYSALILAILSRSSTSNSDIVLAAYSGIWMYRPPPEDVTRDIGSAIRGTGEMVVPCIGVAGRA